MAVLLPVGLVLASSAAASTRTQANRALAARVRHRYPLLTEERRVVVNCRPRRGGFSCLYGVLENELDIAHEGEPEGTVEWAYSGLGWVHVRDGRLYPELIGHIYEGGRFAPG